MEISTTQPAPEMNFVSVTRLRIRQRRFLPAFLWYAIGSTWQARRLGAKLRLHRDRERVFWTITVWPDQASMRAFRNAGAHKVAMPKLFEWCDEGTYVHWEQNAGADAPDLETAHRRLVTEGVVSPVRHPSPRNATRAFPAPK